MSEPMTVKRLLHRFQNTPDPNVTSATMAPSAIWSRAAAAMRWLLLP
jgi:hypothetical protein